MRSLLAILAAALTVLAAAPVAGARLPDEHPLPGVYERVAAYVAGHPVRVECDSIDDMPLGGFALGYLDTADGSIHLGPYACAVLERGAPSGIFGDGLLILIHEAEHAAGKLDESEANCGALARIGEIAARFFPQAPAAAVEEQARRMFGMTPPEYQRCG